MSRAGRFQDALWDYLWGSEDFMGEFYPGPLHKAGMTYDEAQEVCKAVEDMAWRIIDA